MRREFFDYLTEKMQENKRIYLLFAGLGYPRYEEFKSNFRERTINTEASEQATLDIASGLALSEQIPFIYTITPFYWRAAESVRLYPGHERIAVRMVGAGRDDDYSKHDGFSHDAKDIGLLMGNFDIRSYYPGDVDQMKMFVDLMIREDVPSFLSLRR